jgi:CRP/FNR family cyclic AMP-dependent transcriptional regulator
MSSSNQDISECNTTYDPNVALEFFELFGNRETAKEGEKLFEQGRTGFLSFFQSNKMYLLVDGKVTIQPGSGNVIPIEPGEIFGEFTPYSTYNATAITDIPCKLISLDEKQLLAGFKKKPVFLFMLMDVLVKHLHKIDTETKNSPLLAENKIAKKDILLNSKMLNELKEILGETAHTVVPEKRVLFQKGAAASVMYVILDGYMTVSIGDKVIGRSGPGDIVGEIALIAPQHSRTANVVAETRCALLAINRQTLLEVTQKLPGFGITLLRVLISR